jgi:hypothetical protein
MNDRSFASYKKTIDYAYELLYNRPIAFSLLAFFLILSFNIKFYHLLFDFL